MKSKSRELRFKWDVFICHASEDKDDCVNPLASKLRSYELKVWLDRFVLKPGDSLRQSVELGLTKSRYGIVIFSPAFFEKKFPQNELDGLFARERDGRKVILPVWHEIDREGMVARVPMLADKWAVKTSEGISAVARQLIEVIKPQQLKIEKRQEAVTNAASSFIEELTRNNPTLDARVTINRKLAVGAVPLVQIDDLPTKGYLASVLMPDLKIDFRPKDAEAYKLNPLKFELELSEEGVRKFKNFVQTGTEARFDPGEASGTKELLELFGLGSYFDQSTGVLILKQSAAASREIAVRAKFGSGENAVTLPLLWSRAEQIGTDEATILHFAKDAKFSIRTVSKLKPSKEGTFTINFKFAGVDLYVAQKYFRAFLALKSLGGIEITNLETEMVVFSVKSSVESISDEEKSFQRALDDAVQVADSLGLKLTWPTRYAASDFETLRLLKAAVDGVEIAQGVTLSGLLEKAPDSVTRLDSTVGQSVCLAKVEPIEFFGATVPGGTIGFLFTDIQIRDFEETKRRFAAAQEGEKIPIVYESTGPVMACLMNAVPTDASPDKPAIDV